MKYIFSISNGVIKNVAMSENYDDLIVQDSFPAREHREGYKAVLAYNMDNGVYWEYIPMTGAEKREQAYQTEKCVAYEGKMLTVDEANNLWLHYQAENNPKASELTAAIASAKAEIRAKYPDSNTEV